MTETPQEEVKRLQERVDLAHRTDVIARSNSFERLSVRFSGRSALKQAEEDLAKAFARHNNNEKETE